MPHTILKAREVMGNANSNFEELGQILQTDQAIAAKVLRIANSYITVYEGRFHQYSTHPSCRD